MNTEMGYLRGMSLPAVLLRLVLSLALVLNGMGTAAASVQMLGGMAMLPAHQAESRIAKVGASPCAEHHMAMAGQEGKSADPSTPAPQGGKHPAPDCCKSSACRCACVHACPSVTATSVQMPLVIAHDLSGRTMSLGHPTPALPHLIRPPIG